MREIETREAEDSFDSLLDLVEKGEEIVITRRGDRVARLVPDTGGRDRDKARKAAEKHHRTK